MNSRRCSTWKGRHGTMDKPKGMPRSFWTKARRVIVVTLWIIVPLALLIGFIYIMHTNYLISWQIRNRDARTMIDTCQRKTDSVDDVLMCMELGGFDFTYESRTVY